MSFLQHGPAGSLAIVRDVLGIAQANRHTADRIATTLLAPDRRFSRTLDGRWTDSLADLYDAAGHVKAGTTVVVKVKRAGKEVELKVTPTAGL